MNFDLIAISLPPDQRIGGTPLISGYQGDPLYSHVEPDTHGGVAIRVDQFPPSSNSGVGAISSITVTYVPPSPGSQSQTLVYSPVNPKLEYKGHPIDMHLKLLGTEDAGSAILVLTEQTSTQFDRLRRAAETDVARQQQLAEGREVDTDEIPGIFGMLVVQPDVDNGELSGFFVNVPVTHPTKALKARVKFPKPGSVSGPIGSVNVP